MAHVKGVHASACRGLLPSMAGVSKRCSGRLRCSLPWLLIRRALTPSFTSRPSFFHARKSSRENLVKPLPGRGEGSARQQQSASRRQQWAEPMLGGCHDMQQASGVHEASPPCDAATTEEKRHLLLQQCCPDGPGCSQVSQLRNFTLSFPESHQNVEPSQLADHT